MSQDHLDYHADMESYFQAKRKLFLQSLRESQKEKKWGAINAEVTIATTAKDENESPLNKRFHCLKNIFKCRIGVGVINKNQTPIFSFNANGEPLTQRTPMGSDFGRR